MKQLIIPVSFKKSEIELYNTIKEKSGYSNWIKDIIKEHLNNSNNKNNNDMLTMPVYREWD